MRLSVPLQRPRWHQLRAQADRMRHAVTHLALAGTLAPAVHLWNKLLNRQLRNLSPAENRALETRFRRLLARDFENVEQGHYSRELLFQFPLASYLALTPKALIEFPRIFWRKRHGGHDALPGHIDRSAYPKYYLRTFHWQSDGWFSDHSAKLYDAGVEFLFLGTADIMRRMALSALVKHLPSQAKVLDIACGTGRFLLQLAQTKPDAQLLGLDLSPNYLAYAERLVSGANVDFLQSNAEGIPLEDASFDATTSVFLFHELPKDARRRVMAEAFRVTRPGGIFVLCDSSQYAGSEGLEFVLNRFPQTYHEPYYKSYLRDDLAQIMAHAGFTVFSDEQHMVSRVLVGRRPES